MLKKEIAKFVEMTSLVRTNKNSSTREIVFRGLVFYLKYIVIAFFVIALVLLITRLTGIEVENIGSSKEFKDSFRSNILCGLFEICLFGPFLEELLFRLWLTFKRSHILISAFVLFYALLTLCILPHTHECFLFGFQSDYFEKPIIKCLISLILSSPILFIKKDRLESFKGKYGQWLVYFSVLCFALGHITNINCEWYIYPFLIIMCLPQLVMGTTITYYRLNIGFFAGFLFHIIINFIPTFISYHSEIVGLFGN